MDKVCQWIVEHGDDGDQSTTCGAIATHEVTVKTKITQAKVWLCPAHKREHNVSFAAARTTRKPA